MGGPSKSDLSYQSGISQQQFQISQDQNALAKQDRVRMDTLTKPAIDFYTAVSKDKESSLAASAPQIANITAGSKAAKENIFDTVPVGPGRDVALAMNERGKASDIASTRNTTFTAALDKIANIGAGFGANSLQEIGASLSGSQAAAGTEGSVLQAKSAKKASTMGLIGSFAGAAGTAYAG